METVTARTREATLGKREALARAIADVAEATISEHGLGSLRARDLADAVGCSLGYIYKIFPDLDAVVLAVGMRTLALLEARFHEAVDAPAKDAAADELGSAVDRLVALSLAYLDFAAAHTRRWRALFEHRLPEGTALPEDFAREKGRLFSYVEEPLRVIRPDLGDAERKLLARSLFSAAHGMVTLGLEEKLAPVGATELRAQVSSVVRAAAIGLRSSR